jgi:hypothetical protein
MNNVFTGVLQLIPLATFFDHTLGGNQLQIFKRDIIPYLYGPLWPHHSDHFIHATSLRGVNVFLFVT